MRHHALPVPDDVVTALRAKKVRRLIATINGREMRRALQTHAEGGGFIVLGREALAELGLKRGSEAKVVLRPDPEPDALDMPEVFALVLAQDDAARARWESFPIGRRRSLLHYVNAARQEATRIKRSWELAEKMRTHSLYGDTKS